MHPTAPSVLRVGLRAIDVLFALAGQSGAHGETAMYNDAPFSIDPEVTVRFFHPDSDTVPTTQDEVPESTPDQVYTTDPLHP